MNERYISIALSSDADVHSEKMILGLSSALAARLIDATLDRPQRSAAHLCLADLSQGEIGALLFALDRAGKDWLDAGGDKFVVRGPLEDTSQIPDYLGRMPLVEIQAKLQTATQSLPLRLWCNTPDGLRTMSKCRSINGARSLNVRVGLCAGWSVLTLKEATNIAVGDRIVLDAWNHPKGSGGLFAPTLWNGSWHRFGRFIDNEKIVLISEPEREAEMDTTNQSDPLRLSWSSTDVDDADAREMNVTVRVEVGSIKMSVEQALGLVPGRVIRLDRPLSPEVNVFIGDKFLGRGTMVDVDGLMAVEIGELR
jgi:flagellar motor switch/type III secretory pathway protein FliN